MIIIYEVVGDDPDYRGVELVEKFVLFEVNIFKSDYPQSCQ